MDQPRTMPLWPGRTLALVGILLVALNLRSAVAGLSPILGHISKDLPLSAVLIGILGAAPPVAFALSGLLAPLLARRLGLELAVLATIAAMVVGNAARALAPTASFLLGASVVALLGFGVANVLLPPLVKRYFPDRIGMITATYVTVLSISTAVPPLIAVPLAGAAGWRVSLGIWVFVALAAAPPWIILALRQRRARSLLDDADPAEAHPRFEGKLWHSSVAWAIAVTFGVSSLNAYATFAWLPSVLIARAGVTPAQAGALLALYAIMGFPASLVVPFLATRLRNVGRLIFLGVLFFLVGYAGLLVAPSAAPVLWVMSIGLGPLLFPLALVLINSRSRTEAGSVALSGFVQGIGYVLGATGPLVVGLLHDATGGWTIPIVFLAITALGGVVSGILLASPRLVEDELATRRP